MATVFEIFYRFLLLGLVSFGGPVAHLGYFRNTFVQKLKWLDDTSYAKLVALSQFLPGPSSSQVGFTIGLQKGGILGAVAAFVAFTFPSFLFLYILSAYDVFESSNPFLVGVIDGLKLFAVVIVADAVLSMFASFCKEIKTKIIFIAATVILLLFEGILLQIGVLIVSAITGSFLLQSKKSVEKTKTKPSRVLPLFLFIALFVIGGIAASTHPLVELFNAFYQAGSLVFGGGHVVLPLLEQSLEGMISSNDFLIGYSLAQGVPGPMFSIASYLGADILKQTPLLGALIATMAIFLPGFLLILTFYESFESYTKKTKILGAIAGVNATVVGLLVAVFISTVFPSGVHSWFDLGIALASLYILRKYKISVFYMVSAFAIVSGLINI
jgi:chromate transporter